MADGGPSNAFQSGGDRLTAMQNDDGGWDWPLDNGNPATGSALNTIGPIGKGLAETYLNTLDVDHLDALEDAGAFLLTKTSFSPSDGYLAVQLDVVFDVTTYTDYVKANYYDKLAAGTYVHKNGITYGTATHVDYIRNFRSGTQANLAAWDIGMGLVAASSIGADITPWLDGVKAEINELDGDASDYDVIGLAGGLYGLAFVGEEFDPISGDFEAASNVRDLADALVVFQLSTGGFTWSKNAIVEDNGDESIQETAYAMLALTAVDQSLYLDELQKAGEFLLFTQLPEGGWGYYLGSVEENNEVTAEALWALSVVNLELWVCETGDCGHPSVSFNTIQAAIDAAAAGDTVFVKNGSYNEHLLINKPLTLQGESRDGVVIDAGASTTYGIYITADDVTLESFTLKNGTTYGIKPSGADNFTLRNVTVQNTGHSGIDLNGVNIATIDDVDVSGVVNGVGIALTDSNNIMVKNSHTSNNSYSGGFSSGVMISASGAFYPGGCSNLTFENNVFDEPAPMYSERANNDPDDGSDEPFAITNLVLGNYDYALMTVGSLGAVYYESFADAKAAAQAYATAIGGDLSLNAIKSVSTNTFFVDQDLKIQSAINLAIDGDTINVAAGTYAEDVSINKAIILQGPNAGINPNTQTRNPEAVILLGTQVADPMDAVIWYLEVSGIKIDGFTFDGDNPAFTSSVNVNGANIDSGEGISSYEGIGNVSIENNVLKNFSYAALDFYNYYNSAPSTSENYIRYNLIDNIGGSDYGIGVLVYNNFYADISDNVIIRSRVGIQTGNYHKANVGSTARIANNYIEASRRGLFYNLMYSSSSAFEVVDNNFVGLASAIPSFGIAISSIQSATPTFFEDNDISGFTYGVSFWNTPTTSMITYKGGLIEDCDYGIFPNNYDGYSSNGSSETVAIESVIIRNSNLAAVYVKDNPSNTNNATVHLNVLDGNVLENNPVDFFIEGPDASISLNADMVGPFMWNVKNTSIQAIIDESRDGDTIVILPGLYEETLTINKRVKLIGSGNGTDPTVDTILRKPTGSAASIVTVSASGLSVDEPLLLQDIRIEPQNVYGINLSSLQYLKLDGVNVFGSALSASNESEVCLKVATTADVKYLDIVDSAFNQCDYGWYFAKSTTAGELSNVQFVTVTHTTFNNNDYKGGYVEKLSDALFDNVFILSNGDASFWNQTWNGGFDINLKNGDYQNLTFQDMTVVANGLGQLEGAGLMIKARDDGSYAPVPATLTNVRILGGTYTGNERGIRFGEPTKNNATPTNVVIRNANISSNVGERADGSFYGGVINHTQAIVDARANWWGDSSGPFHTTLNIAGHGNAVSDRVLFDPWVKVNIWAGDDSYLLDEDQVLTVSATMGVLANDFDALGTELTAVDFTQPAHGSLIANLDGSFTYTPDADYNGTDFFLYRAKSGDNLSGLVRVDLTINSVEDSPVAVSDTFNAVQNVELVVSAANGVLKNDSDADGDLLTAVLEANVLHGTLNFNTDGSFSYMPEENFIGEDSFTYHVNAGGLSSSIVTVTLNVLPGIPVTGGTVLYLPIIFN